MQVNVDDDLRVPWRAIFENARPVEVEVGPGRGETLLAAAAAAPAVNFFAIERTFDTAEALVATVTRRGLHNVRVVTADARDVIAHFVPADSVSAYHVYFPDPWPKRRQHHRRLVTRESAPHIARTLVAGGVLHLATDVRALYEEFTALLVAAGLVHERDAVPPRRPMTKYERRYAGEGTVYARLRRP